MYARPLIIRNEVPAKNINKFIEYLKNKMQFDDTEFYKYLRLIIYPAFTIYSIIY